MNQTIQHPCYTFSWTDLGVPDVSAVSSFYRDLFNWEEERVQMGQWSYVTYSVLGQEMAGQAVAGLYEMNPGQLKLGYPITWIPYLWVDDVDHTTELIKQLGGKVLREPFDSGNQGRTASVQDPSGATFYLWYPQQHQGAQLVNASGALSWVELSTPDIAQAEQFYVKIFGWEPQAQMVGDEKYVTFYQNNEAVAGMVETPNKEARWRVYFGVEACDEIVSRAELLGGEITIPPTAIPEFGHVAALRDPLGVGFAIVETPTKIKGHYARFSG